MDKKAFTTVLPEVLIEKIRDLSWWSRMSITDLTTAAMSQYIREWEDKNGPVPPKDGEKKLELATAIAGESDKKEETRK